MSTQIVSVTIQAALFSALSTTLAQSITAYKTSRIHFDIYSFISFMVIAMIMTPPNYMYQRWLEDSFPTSVVDDREAVKDDKGKGKERLSKTNTVAKFLLDQSIGAMANTAGFIVLAGLAKGHSLAVIRMTLRQDFLPMLTASWRVWPTVTLLNLVVVPFDYRMLLGNCVGVCWGVYVTLRQM